MKRNDPLTVMHRGHPIRAWMHRVDTRKGALHYAVPILLTPMSTISEVRTYTFGLEEEGIAWMRGFDDETCAALRAAHNLAWTE